MVTQAARAEELRKKIEKRRKEREKLPEPTLAGGVTTPDVLPSVRGQQALEQVREQIATRKLPPVEPPIQPPVQPPVTVIPEEELDVPELEFVPPTRDEVTDFYAKIFPDLQAITSIHPDIVLNAIGDLANQNPDDFRDRLTANLTTEESRRVLDLLGVPEEAIEAFLSVPELAFEDIPPEGLTLELEDEFGFPIELTIFEDFEFVGTERTKVSDDLIVFSEGREVGRINYETAEFTPIDLSFWQKLGIGASSVLEKIFIPASFVGSGIGYLGEQFSLRAAMSQEEWEELQASGLPVASLSDFQKFLPGGEYHERFQRSPLWVKLLLELPFWIGLARGGTSALGTIKALDRAAAEGLIPKAMATSGRILLETTTLPTIERVTGAAIRQVIGRLVNPVLKRVMQRRWSKQVADEWAVINKTTQKAVLEDLDVILKDNPELVAQVTPQKITQIAAGMDDIIKAGGGFRKLLASELKELGLELTPVARSQFARQSARRFARFSLEWSQPRKPAEAVTLLRGQGLSTEEIAALSVDRAWELVGETLTKAAVAAVTPSVEEVSPITQALITEGEEIVTKAEALQPDNEAVKGFREAVDKAKATTDPEVQRQALIEMEGLEAEVREIAGIPEVGVTPVTEPVARPELVEGVTPEVVTIEQTLEVPVVEPVEGVAIPATDINESIPPEIIVEPTPEVADGNIVVHDVNVIDRFIPSRFVFEKMGLFDIWQSAFEAETLKAEEQLRFNKELNKHAKAVGKDIARRELIWEFVNNNNQTVFKQLTFKEKQAAKWWKRTADDWADRLNIPQERRIKDYIPHIFDEAASQAKDAPVDASFAMLFSKKITDKVKMPFLEQRLGKELGLVKDPFLAAQTYENVALRKFYYEPILQKLKLVSEHETTPEFARNFLKEYSKRLTGEPAGIDREINKFLADMGDSIRGLPGGDALANFLSQGNPSAMAAYNLTSGLYFLWLGFKPTSAIRNLSQHGLIIAEVDSIQDFGNGIRLRFTKEGKEAINESLVVRSRRGAFIESIDSSVIEGLPAKFRETALFLFRKADEQNVKDAFLSGYAEAKRLYPDADRVWWIKRGDEVAADTQYLYTKMNSLSIAQSGPGKVFAMLTTWAINWLELMNKWVRGKPSRTYQELVASDPKFKLKEKNWLTSRKSLLIYMAIVGLAYGLKQQDWNKVKTFEYTGFTSIRTFANLAGGEFPALQLPGAVADLISGVLLGDERQTKTAWNQLKRSFSILNQLEAVASGERDWLSLFFYLEGKNFQVRKLKEDWEDNWKPYDDLSDPLIRAKEFPTLNRNTAQKRWREQNPKIEAQMFITNRLGTLSSDEARAETLRLIEKHDIDTDVIEGYEKIFGVDTTQDLSKSQRRIGNLEKFEIGKEAKYYTVGNHLSEVNKAVKTQGRDKVERDGHPFSVFLLGEQDSWQPYDDYDNADARKLYRQQFPDVEASLYLTSKIGSFENPESAKILLQIMDKYNIPPQAINAFNEDPDKYDELFTQKFELEQKNFELTTEFENFGNSEATNFIEDKEERKLARTKFKEDNPDWVADQRRIEAIDNDATPAQTEKWVERGQVIDKFNPTGSEAQAWLLDNPEMHQWALDNKLLSDDGSDWNEKVIRLQVKWRETDEVYDELPTEGDVREQFLMSNPQYNDGRRRRTMFGLDAPEFVNDFVDYGHVIDEFSSGSSQAKIFRLEHPELSKFGESKDTLGWEELDKGQESVWRIDVDFEKEDNLYQAILDTLEGKQQSIQTGAFLIAHPEYHRKRFERDALKLDFSRVDEYVTWHTDSTLKRPETLEEGLPFYKDDWYLMEHQEFYREMLKAEIFTKRRDFRLVPMKDGKPDRVVGEKYIEYLLIKDNQSLRDRFRLDNRALDEWGVRVGIWTRTMSERRRRQQQTATERFEADVRTAEEEREEALEKIGEKIGQLK